MYFIKNGNTASGGGGLTPLLSQICIYRNLQKLPHTNLNKYRRNTLVRFDKLKNKINLKKRYIDTISPPF